MLYQGQTRSGASWTPQFITKINPESCIGCGRCFKVCAQKVLGLMAVTEDGEIVDLDTDEEIEKKVMVVENGDDCIGCMACAKVCGSKAQSYAPLDIGQ